MKKKWALKSRHYKLDGFLHCRSYGFISTCSAHKSASSSNSFDSECTGGARIQRNRIGPYFNFKAGAYYNVMLFYRLIPSSKWNSLFYRSSKGPAYSLSMQRQLRFRPLCSVTPWIRSFPPRLRLAEIKEILSRRAERPPERRMGVNAAILSECGAFETHLEWLWLKDRVIYLSKYCFIG